MPITNPSTPDSLSWSRHPISWQFNSDAAGDLVELEVEVMIVAGPDYATGTLRATADANGDASFNVAGLLNAQLSYAAPDLGALVKEVPSVSCRYYLQVSEYVDGVLGANYTSGSDYYAIKGEQSFYLLQTMYLPIDEAKDYLFLRAKPEERRLFTWQEEVVSLLFNTTVVAATLQTVLYYTDNTDNTVQDLLGDYPKGAVVSCSFGFRYRNWDQINPAKTISRIEVSLPALNGGTIIYQVSQDKISPDSRSYIFVNKAGGYSSLAASGQLGTKDQTKGQLYTRDTGVTGIVSQPTVDIFEQSSGYFPRPEIEACAQMRDINNAWLHLKDGQLASLTIRPGTTDRERDGRNLNAFTFTYSFGTGRQDFNIINALEFIAQGGGLQLPISINDVTNLSANLAALLARDELQPQDLGTNPAAWDFQNKEIRHAKMIIDDDITLVTSGAAKLVSIILWLDVTNTVTLDLAGFHFTGTLPDDVSWSDLTEELTISNGSNTAYMIAGTVSALDGFIVCNIQLV